MAGDQRTFISFLAGILNFCFKAIPFSHIDLEAGALIAGVSASIRS